VIEVRQLSALLSYQKGKPPRKEARSERYLPLLTPEYLRGNAEPELVPVTPDAVLLKGDELVLLWDGSNAGEFFRAKLGILASTMVVFKFDGSQVTHDYLFYEFKRFEAHLKGQTSGSGIPHVDKEILLNHAIRLISRRQQSKIAEILSTVDRALEQTQALIAKYQRMKTGLMQDLLTRGIDEQGRLRHPDTHEFKDSRLGRIPVEWEVKNLGGLLVEMPRNGIYKPAKDIGSGTLIIGQLAIDSEEKIDYSRARRAKILSSELDAFGLQNGDLLVTRVFATPEGVGRSVLIETIPEPAVYESNMMRIRANRELIKPLFLFRWLKTHFVRRHIESSLNASNQSSINQVALNSVPCAIPSIFEQEVIIERFEKIEGLIRTESVNLEKRKKLKSGLMQDLLSGHKSVESLLREVATLTP
jgi:type I restriction enzyme, S subunit